MRKLIKIVSIISILLFSNLQIQATAPLYFPDYMGIINVLDYGAKGDGSTDDTVAIQAANDAAYAAKRQGVYLPATGNCYKTTAPLYLDAPGNLRGNFANPINFNFSLAIYGDKGLGNNTQRGTQICPTFLNDCALYVGPGQGMVVRDITILGPVVSYRKLMSSGGCGVGITGGNGGSSRVLVENVGVQNYYYCFRTAANGNGTLGDSNTWQKIWADSCAYGVFVGGTQNFINSCYDCNINNSNIAFSSAQGTGATISGGNFSATTGVSAAFAISGTSSITATGNGNANDYSFTTTLATDDIYMRGCTASASCNYTACSLATASFGIVPVTITAYNTGTKVASLKMLTAWSLYYFPADNAVTSSDLQTEIQAASKLYCAEQVVAVEGSGIKMSGVHLENPIVPTLFVHSVEHVGQNRSNYIDNVFFNYDPALSVYAPVNNPTDANLAKYYAAMQFPLIWMENADLQITNCDLGAATDPIMIDVSPNGAESHTFIANDLNRFRANTRTANGNGGFGNNGIPTLNSPNFGSGVLDENYALPIGITGGNSQGLGWLASGGGGQSLMWGFRPATWSRPALIPSIVTTISSVTLPGIISNSSGANITYSTGYPPIWGGQNYQLSDWYVGSQTGYNIVSNHHFYTLGQNLTTSNIPNLSVTYKGQSFAVNANIELLRLLWPGLGIKLNNGSGNVLYIVTNVFPGLGYFTVAGAQSATDTSRLVGTKTTTYGPITTVGQEVFNLTKY